MKPGGCSGFNYDMFFDSEFADDDIVREFGGVKVVVDAASADLLTGSTLDFADWPPGRGIPHHEPQRDAHLRLRQLLQLRSPMSSARSVPTLTGAAPVTSSSSRVNSASCRVTTRRPRRGRRARTIAPGARRTPSASSPRAGATIDQVVKATLFLDGHGRLRGVQRGVDGGLRAAAPHSFDGRRSRNCPSARSPKSNSGPTRPLS